jgi:hypothetical protein
MLESQGKASNGEKFVEAGYISPKVVSFGETKSKKLAGVSKCERWPGADDVASV